MGWRGRELNKREVVIMADDTGLYLGLHREDKEGAGAVVTAEELEVGVELYVREDDDAAAVVVLRRPEAQRLYDVLEQFLTKED